MTSNKPRPTMFPIDPEAGLAEIITDFKFFLIYDLDYDSEDVDQYLQDNAGFEFEFEPFKEPETDKDN